MKMKHKSFEAAIQPKKTTVQLSTPVNAYKPIANHAGKISLAGGSAFDSNASGGDITVIGGSSVDGDGGSISLTSGVSSRGATGSLILESSSGVRQTGSVLLRSGSLSSGGSGSVQISTGQVLSDGIVGSIDILAGSFTGQKSQGSGGSLTLVAGK